MIKFDVCNRFTGAVQFTAEIECGDDAPASFKLGLAVRWALKSRADLRCADLSGAYLRGAYLRGANLRGANLSGAKIVKLVGRATRSDGYEAFGWLLDDGRKLIRGGCQTMTLDEYRARSAGYDDPNKTTETNRILDYLDACFKTAEAGQ